MAGGHPWEFVGICLILRAAALGLKLGFKNLCIALRVINTGALQNNAHILVKVSATHHLYAGIGSALGLNAPQNSTVPKDGHNRNS